MGTKKNIVNKKNQNSEKRKYEFKSEKRKKKIISSILFGVAIILTLVGITVGSIALYNSINNKHEKTHKKAYFGPITLEYTSNNNGIIINDKNYTKGNYLTESAIGNNIIYGSNYGTTELNIRITFPKYLTKNSIKTYKTKPYIRRVGYYYKLVNYKDDGTKISESSCRLISSTTGMVEKTKINTGSSYSKLEVYKGSECSGLLIKTKKTKTFATTPKITAKVNNTNISSGVPLVLKEEKNYGTTFTITSATNENLYYRWFTFENYNWSTLFYKENNCRAFNKSVITNPDNAGLKLNASMPKRMGYLRVYRSKSLCDNDNDAIYSNQYNVNGTDYKYITSFIIQLKYNVTTPTASNIKVEFKETKKSGTLGKVDFTVRNYNSAPIYYKWATVYNGKLGWNAGKCIKVNGASYDTSYGEIGLSATKSNGRIYTYYDSNCKNLLTTKDSPNYYGDSAPYIDSEGFKVIPHNTAAITKAIGSQSKGNCNWYAMAYGTYIITSGKVAPTVGSDSPSHYGAFSETYSSRKNYMNLIKAKIDAGIPVVIHVTSSEGQHYVTVIGYKPGVVSANMTTEHLRVIDPYKKPRCTKSGSLSDKKLSSLGYSIRDYNVKTWSSVNSANNIKTRGSNYKDSKC